LNIASCSIKLGLWRNAVNNASKALEYDPNNAKALFRRGQGNFKLANFDEATKDLERAKELSGGDAAVVQELAAVKAAIEQEKAKEKKMFSKMFG
jgi:peptidyl-prolyl isomerase D